MICDLINVEDEEKKSLQLSQNKCKLMYDANLFKNASITEEV